MTLHTPLAAVHVTPAHGSVSVDTHVAVVVMAPATQVVTPLTVYPESHVGVQRFPEYRVDPAAQEPEYAPLSGFAGAVQVVELA